MRRLTFGRLQPIIRRLRARLLALKEAPRKVALGFALGILVGMTPFWGVHIPTSLLTAVALRWSKFAALIGVQITNVGTAPLIYPVNYWVGVHALGVSRQVAWPESLDYGQMLQLIGKSPLILVDLCAGGLILGLPLAVGGYFLALQVVQRLQIGPRTEPGADAQP